MHLVRAGYAADASSRVSDSFATPRCIAGIPGQGELVQMEGITALRLLYDVSVRNELSGEVTTVSVLADCVAGAQVEALVALFKTRGWRRAVATPPGAGIAADLAELALDVA